MILEIVVETCEDALNAEAGGADQIEVKSDYLEYGLTPSAGMLSEICRRVSCDVICMIRPHARSNVYSPSDIAAMISDIEMAKVLPIKGFILGCLTADRKLDIKNLELLKNAAGELDLHFHLAWELTENPILSLKQLVSLGFSSVRTSGGGGIGGQVLDNVRRIAEYNKLLQSEMDLYLAGGITINNVSQIVSETGISNIHSGSGVRFPEIRTGEVVEDKVRALKKALIAVENQH